MIGEQLDFWDLQLGIALEKLDQGFHVSSRVIQARHNDLADPDRLMIVIGQLEEPFQPGHRAAGQSLEILGQGRLDIEQDQVGGSQDGLNLGCAYAECTLAG